MSPRPSRSTAARAASMTPNRNEQPRIYFLALGAGSLVTFLLGFLRVYHGVMPPM